MCIFLSLFNLIRNINLFWQVKSGSAITRCVLHWKLNFENSPSIFFRRFLFSIGITQEREVTFISIPFTFPRFSGLIIISSFIQTFHYCKNLAEKTELYTKLELKYNKNVILYAKLINSIP